MATNKAERHAQSPQHRLHRLLAAVAIASAVVVVIAGCGSSGKSTSTSATNSSSTKQGASRADRFASLRACLQKEGINLPSAPSAGQPGNGGPPGAGGGFKLPQGVSQSKLEEAMKKCGGGGFPGAARRSFNSSTARAALTKYASCMGENGVNLPTPNTSGNGPVFNTKGIDTSSTAFKKAQQKCQGDLNGAFAAGRPPGGGEGGPPGGSPSGEIPPAGEGSPSS
jgi:hypothetical protein